MYALAFIIKLDQWILHEFTIKQREKKINTCASFFFCNFKEPFFNQIDTNDKKWILWRIVKHRMTMCQCCRTYSIDLNIPKLFYSVNGWCKGYNQLGVPRSNQMINADLYCQQMNSLWVKYTCMGLTLISQWGVVFHHDTARSHLTWRAQQIFLDLGYNFLTQ